MYLVLKLPMLEAENINPGLPMQTDLANLAQHMADAIDNMGSIERIQEELPYDYISPGEFLLNEPCKAIRLGAEALNEAQPWA